MLQILILSVRDDMFGMHMLQNEGVIGPQAVNEFQLVLSDGFHSRALRGRRCLIYCFCDGFAEADKFNSPSTSISVIVSPQMILLSQAV